MTDNRMIQELRGALCELLKACKAADTYGLDEKAVARAEWMLSETRKRKEQKRCKREAVK